MSLSLIVSPGTSAEGRLTVAAGGKSLILDQTVLDKILGGSLSLDNKKQELIDTITSVEHTHRNRFDGLLEEKIQIDVQYNTLKELFRDKATTLTMLEARVIVEQAVENAHQIHKDPVAVAAHPLCLHYHNKNHKKHPTPKKPLVAHLLEPCPLISAIQTKHGKGPIAWTLSKGNHLAPYTQATSTIFGTLSTGVHLGDDTIDDLIKAEIAKKTHSSSSSSGGSTSLPPPSSSGSTSLPPPSSSGLSLKRKRQDDCSGPTAKKSDKQLSLDDCYVQFGDPVMHLNVKTHKRVDIPPAGSVVYIVNMKAQQGKQVYFWTVGTGEDSGVSSYSSPKRAPPLDAIFYELSKGLDKSDAFEHELRYTLYDLPGAATAIFKIARDKESRGPMPPSAMDI